MAKTHQKQTSADLAETLAQASEQLHKAVEDFRKGIDAMTATPEWKQMLSLMETLGHTAPTEPPTDADRAERELLLFKRLDQFHKACQGWRTDGEHLLSHYIQTVVGKDAIFHLPEVFTEPLSIPGLAYVGNQNEYPPTATDFTPTSGRVVITGAGVTIYHFSGSAVDTSVFRVWGKEYAHQFKLHFDTELSQLVKFPPRRGFEGWR